MKNGRLVVRYWGWGRTGALGHDGGGSIRCVSLSLDKIPTDRFALKLGGLARLPDLWRTPQVGVLPSLPCVITFEMAALLAKRASQTILRQGQHLYSFCEVDRVNAAENSLPLSHKPLPSHTVNHCNRQIRHAYPARQSGARGSFNPCAP